MNTIKEALTFDDVLFTKVFKRLPSNTDIFLKLTKDKFKSSFFDLCDGYSYSPKWLLL